MPASPDLRRPQPALSPENLRAWVDRRERTRRRILLALASLLVVAAGVVAVGWSLYHRQFALIGKLGSQGYRVDWDINLSNYRSGGVTAVSYAPRWYGGGMNDRLDDLGLIPLLNHVESLDLSAIDLLRSSDLAFLADLPELKILELNRTIYPRAYERPTILLDDSVVDLIATRSELTVLGLADNRITDVGVAKLANLPRLENLDLTGNPITDQGLKALTGMKSLRLLRVEKTKVTPTGVMALQRALPLLEVSQEINGPPSDEQ